MRKDKDTIIIECRCNGFEFVKFGKYDDETYITISSYPKTFKEKLKVIWRTIIGAEVPYMSDEILLSKQDVKELINFLK